MTLSPARRRLLSLGVGIVLAAGLAVALFAGGGQGSVSAAGFSLPRLGGGPVVSLPVLVDGRRVPVVITFFASWCGPCHEELPIVARVAKSIERSKSDVAFIGIDGNDDPASGLAFASSSGVSFPVGEDSLSAVAPRFGLPGYPATVFIDAAGDVLHVVRGPVSAATLRTWAARVESGA